ncbi:MAG TPA: N-formylglutamate amidohydrolase [Woeseiaceae bacterium]|nr:N-formylglutamate amidohydrolase [Woeseiaceae bacterium]
MLKPQPADDSPGLLAAHEPPAFKLVNGSSKQPLLLVCDHASNRIPESLANLGLDSGALRSHLALDLGAAELTGYLAERLGAAAVLAQYSRLVVDCNRDLQDPGAFLGYGDGIEVRGNSHLGRHDKDLRARAIYHPYHGAIDAQLRRLLELQMTPIFLSIHSFTPVLDGVARAWEVGILWDQDQGLHEYFLDAFRGAGLVAGDNEPYSGKDPADFTIDHHGEANKLPCVAVEVRQDLLSSTAGVARIGNLIQEVIAGLLERGSEAQKPANGPRRNQACNDG